MCAIIKPRLSTVENPISFFIDPPHVLIYFQDHLTVDIKMAQIAAHDVIYISNSTANNTSHFLINLSSWHGVHLFYVILNLNL